MRLVAHAEANPAECMRVNVEGALALAVEATRAGVSKVVAISSDKAVAPTTIYGSSKFAMERILVDADRRSNTRFSLVRYANILNSRSSVAPLFLQQREHGFLTITDPNMTRFSIVMREGIDLIMFAIDYGWGGELICPIAPSYRVGDMAMAIAPRVKHRLIGARPGEKLHEAMFGLTEAPYVAKRDGYYIVTPTVGRWALSDYCRDVQEAQVFDEVREYASDANDEWLDVNALRSLIKRELGAQC
jgi:FlaA1/EpsC-like NDP-sugar epimerase